MTHRRYTRRTALKAAGAAAGLVGAPAVLRRAWAADPIRVSCYGGYFEDALSENAYPEFTKATGIEVESVSQGNGFEWFVNLEQSVKAGTPAVDITIADVADILRMPSLFTPLAEDSVPNLVNVSDYLIRRNEAGVPLGAPVMAWYTILVTNTEVWPEAPTSWADAWDPKFEGELGWYKDASASFVIDVVAKTFFGGNDIMNSDEGLMQCMEKAAELKDNVRLWYRDEGQFQSMLQSGELTGGMYFHDVTQIMAMEGHPVRSTFPKEGGIIGFGSWCMLRDTPKADACLEFIKWSLSPEAQTLITTNVGTGPVLPRDMLPDLTDEAFDRAASTVEPIVPHYQVYVDKGDWITERWDELLSRV